MNPREQALRTRLETGDFQRSFLVEAGAGAGKSHTICQRILHQLLAGQDPRSVAAITFTEKATLELQEKLDRQALDYDRAHGANLADLTARVHISTIHSFCQTALSLFPLETNGTPQVLPEAGARAEAFFRAWTARDADGTAAALEAFGGSVRALEGAFVSMAAEGHVPALPDPAQAAARRQVLDDWTNRAHEELRKHLLPHRGVLAALPEALRQAAEAPALTAEQAAALRRTLLSAWKQGTRPKRLAALFFTGDPAVKYWVGEYLEASKKTSQKADPARLGRVPPVFAAMDGFLTWLGGEKELPAEALAEAERTAGYDLALAVLAPALEAYRAREERENLVSFSGLLTRTRDLVRRDPAARALLHRRYRVFYVDEFQDTDPVQAELLFLITDQGGTELDWTRCRPAPGSLFLVGDPKQAIYRFRGADLEVYKRVKALFTDPRSPVGEVVNLRANFRSSPRICAFADRVFAPLLDGGPLQADYAPMEAQQGDPGGEAVFSYPARCAGQGDADRVARFIRRAVEGRYALPDRRGKPVPIRYGDFLLLTAKKSSAGAYLEALSRLGVPVSFSGSRPLAENPQTGRLEAWLQWLTEPDSEIALLRVLARCYGVRDPEDVRRLKAEGPLSLLALREERRAAVMAPELRPLVEALGDMGAVLADCRALPPMAALEKLAEERLFWAGDASAPREAERQYGDLRQILRQLRRSPERDFAALARAALDLCRGSLERELPLSPAADAVRVMNLHKAKGLEGKIVILAADTRGAPAVSKAGNVCPITRPNRFGSPSALYAPPDWETLKGREMDCLLAERVRLDYVAATRAEQLLLIAGGEMGRNRQSCWQAMADNAPPVSPNDPRWGDLFAPLLGSGGAAPSVPAPAPGPGAADLTGQREGLIQTLSVPAALRTSPSVLDKSHSVLPSPDPEDPPEEAPPLEREENAARGTDWGTAVHRVMELCVSRGAPDPEAARPLIAQALRETVPPLSRMSGTQRKLLFGGETPESDEAGARVLAEKLERAVSFWFDPASPLRRLTGEGVCHCELPFSLPLSPEDALWPFIRERLDCREDFAGTISVSGILDLAVLTEEGWHIVDYKTDLPRPGEDPAAYRRRLTGEYGAQLAAYARILRRLSGREVLGTRLCAVPLGGELIELP